MTKEQAIDACRQAQAAMQGLRVFPEVGAALTLLASLGDMVGYKPAFRALVKNEAPENSVQWKS